MTDPTQDTAGRPLPDIEGHAVPATSASTSTVASPGPRQVLRAARTPVLLALLMIAAATLGVLFTGSGGHGSLDPESVDPDGSRAVARLLAAQGVRIERARQLDEVDAAVSGVAGQTTVLITQPELVPPARLGALVATGADLVLIAPGGATLDAVSPGVRPAGDTGPAVRSPDCTVAAAVAAGPVDLGGQRFHGGPRVRLCYLDGDAGTLAQTTGARSTVTALGSGTPLTNEVLDERGNAALALRLLGAREKLVWFQPALDDPALESGQRSVYQLLPRGWVFGLVQLAVAVLLFALWRARRLGPVVTEPLPVVVRAAETAEGRARLYRRAGDAGHAAAALRGATLDRLIPLLGLSSGPGPSAVTAALAARCSLPAAVIGTLLYGPPPPDDAALVRLADGLDELERKVR